MEGVFLSYARADFFFAQLARLKLEQEGIQVWADTAKLRPGDDWKLEIDQGIDDSSALIVILSPSAMQSSYVTYEWASAMGKGKPIIPVLIEACDRHPKIEAIQHVDFSSPTNQPWNILAERIREVLAEAESPQEDLKNSLPTPGPQASFDEISRQEAIASQINGYLDRRGFRMISFERIRKNIDPNLTDEWLTGLVQSQPSKFRFATIRGGKHGLAKR